LIPTAAQFQASYPNIDCQVRILHGAEDKVIEPSQARNLHALHRSDLLLFQNAGPMVTHSDTAAIATAVSLIADRATSINLVGSRERSLT
jgi:pimeloyl-ACP methyl ester carboxylesterase